MTTGTVEETKGLRRRLSIIWAVAFGLLAIAFAATVITLNTTVFSASGFVSAYLHSLQRHDVSAIVAMAGVEADAEASDALVRRDALGTLSEIELVDDEDRGAGEHQVTFSYRIDGEPARTTFAVQHTGPRLAFFSGWEFTESPLTVIEVVPRNTVEFEVNGTPVVAQSGVGVANRYQVLVPGAYTFSHDSLYLEAEETTLPVTAMNSVEQFTLEAQASQEFEDAVEDELAAYLDRCAQEQVLQPTGCPFGTTIANRIASTPSWSITDYPVVDIVPGNEPGTWIVAPTPGVASLSVDVMSLFDGSVSQFVESTSFVVTYLVTFTADGGLTLTPR
jgi:hypothetical protein